MHVTHCLVTGGRYQPRLKRSGKIKTHIVSAVFLSSLMILLPRDVCKLGFPEKDLIKSADAHIRCDVVSSPFRDDFPKDRMSRFLSAIGIIHIWKRCCHTLPNP